MRLNSQTDYALRMLMYLAVCGDARVSIRDVAVAYKISENHLMKITQRLAALGYVDALRGRNGGLRLAREPADIGVSEIIRAFEPDMALVECFGATNTCPITPACTLRKALGEARQAFFNALDGYTIATLTARPRPLRAALALGD